MIRPALCCCVLLAACASPEERCIADATEDLRVVNGLIAETQGNLDRGYAIETTVEPRVGIGFCTGSSNLRFCSDTSQTIRDRPAAIDLTAEQQKLDSLVAKKAELEQRTRRSLAACDDLA
ncbi:MAG: hypothetical protein AAGA71_03470 [Pseudomonadota bacterium]